jgi:hypothetical protein
MATKKKATKKIKVVADPKPCPAGCYEGKLECASCGGTGCECSEERACTGGCGSCTECHSSTGENECETCNGTGLHPEES